jgi:hypothetical protein
MGLLNRVADGRHVAGLVRSIGHFDFADAVGFQLGLRVKALNSCATDSGSYDH